MYAVQMSQRDAMQLALDANRNLQEQLELVKGQIDKFVEENAKHAASIKQLRVNPGTVFLHTQCLLSCSPLFYQA